MGNCFTVDQYGRQVAVQAPIPQQMPPEVRHAQSMMRRNNAQYAPGTSNDVSAAAYGLGS